MKKQSIICLAFLALLLSACEDAVMPLELPRSEGILSIESIYPQFAVSGSKLVLTGENFGTDINDNYVTINGQFSEVTYVEPGRRIVTIIPKDLSPGEHTLTLFAKGQVSSKTCFIAKDNLDVTPD